MTGLFDTLRAQLTAWSPAEAIAVVCAVLYLLLAIRENIWCWFFAGISTALYVWLFMDARLYMESFLNVFYFGMAIYGWRVWLAGRDAGHEMPVTTWPLRIHTAAIGMIAVLVLISGTMLTRYTEAAFPYVDSATTFAAIWATFLVARKVLENWWYWLAIDAVSIYIYWSRDLELTALLFVVYVAMIPFGLISWTRSYRDEPHALAA
jgi:nicotinamide mononucleotide transporter